MTVQEKFANTIAADKNMNRKEIHQWSTRFHYKSMDELKQELTGIGVRLPLSDSLEALKREVKLGAKTMHNGMAVQPMEGCDGTADACPAELSLRRYDRFARSGAGLIWAEAVAHHAEGRATRASSRLTPGQSGRLQEVRLRYEANLPAGRTASRPIADHAGNPFWPLLQAGGRACAAYRVQQPNLEGDRPIADRVRLVRHVSVRPEIEQVRRIGLVGRAGRDGVDVECANRYLNSELLSAYNREGEARRLAREPHPSAAAGIAAAQAATGSDFIVTSRLNVYDGFPASVRRWECARGEGAGIDLTEPLELVRYALHREMGVKKLLDVTIGKIRLLQPAV